MSWRDLLPPPGAVRVHGGPSAAARASAAGEAPLLDLSVNVNPYGPDAAVLAAIRAAPVERYPDPDALEVREALARRWRVGVEGVAVGNGATELFWSLARALFRRARVLVAEPAFGELRAAAELAGAEVRSARAGLAGLLAPDPAAMAGAIADAVAREEPDAVALCTPTTPTGARLRHRDLRALASAHPGRLFVLDESFLALSDDHAELDASLPGNVVRVRSLTKDHAIPGVRVGYLLGPAEVVRAIEAARPAWTTGAAAQAAALAALGAEPFVAESRARLAVDRAGLVAGLAALGLEPLPSVAPYLAFHAGDAAALSRRLLARGIRVRDCASFGLQGFVRVAVRPAAQRARLLEALEEERR